MDKPDPASYRLTYLIRMITLAMEAAQPDRAAMPQTFAQETGPLILAMKPYVMRPGSWPLQLFAGLLAMSSAFTGFLLLLLAVLFQGNFHFGSLWHGLVFSVTMAAPFLALTGYFIYLRRLTWRAFGFSLAGSALIGITWLLWIAPLSRGLIH